MIDRLPGWLARQSRSHPRRTVIGILITGLALCLCVLSAIIPTANPGDANRPPPNLRRAPGQEPADRRTLNNIQPIPIRPDTSSPTATKSPTNAPTHQPASASPVLASASPTAPPATSPPPQAQPGPCDCSFDRYNCADFATPWSAQQCFDHCRRVTGQDIHRLDRDNDGNACEWKG